MDRLPSRTPAPAKARSSFAAPPGNFSSWISSTSVLAMAGIEPGAAAGEIHPPVQFLAAGDSPTFLTPVASPQELHESTRGVQEPGDALHRPPQQAPPRPRRSDLAADHPALPLQSIQALGEHQHIPLDVVDLSLSLGQNAACRRAPPHRPASTIATVSPSTPEARKCPRWITRVTLITTDPSTC
jgi:hypothetical protein